MTYASGFAVCEKCGTSDCDDCGCDHDWEWVDDSFDHEYGTDQCGHYKCVHCDEVDSDSPAPEYHFDDDVI